MWDPMLGGDPGLRQQAIAAISAGVPLGTMGCVKDVAHVALFLVPDESKYITGVELTIDGGILAGSSAAPKRSNSE